MLTIKWKTDNEDRLVAVWNDDVRARQAHDCWAEGVAAQPARPGGPPGKRATFAGAAATLAKHFCRTELPTQAGGALGFECSGAKTPSYRCAG